MSSKGKIFSERMGIVKEKIIQKDDIDYDTRIVLYNTIHQSLIHDISAYKIAMIHKGNKMDYNEQVIEDKDFETIEKGIWLNVFKDPIDLLPKEMKVFCLSLREFMTTCEWYRIYELIEYILKNYNWHKKSDFIDVLNIKLEEEKTAYRIVSDEVALLTDEQEIKELEEVLTKAESVFFGVYTHLKSALHFFSERTNPDYRNSIKESISAVESICKIIVGSEKADLRTALNRLEKKGIKIHAAMKTGYEKLYSYTSDEKGIRHALIDFSNASYEDAKYMLVSCTSFINYLIVKADKAGIFGSNE